MTEQGPPTVPLGTGPEPVGGGVQGGSGHVPVCGPLSWRAESGKHGGGCADLAWGFADLIFLLALGGWRSSEQDTFLTCLVKAKRKQLTRGTGWSLPQWAVDPRWRLCWCSSRETWCAFSRTSDEASPCLLRAVVLVCCKPSAFKHLAAVCCPEPVWWWLWLVSRKTLM